MTLMIRGYLQQLKYVIQLLIIAVPMVSGCHDDGYDEWRPIANEINIQFDLLDAQGNSATTFEQGENFIFSLIVTNQSDELVVFRGFDYDDFCRVKLLESFEPNENRDQPRDMGKPFYNMFCQYSSPILLPKSDLKFQIQWVPPETWEPGSPYNGPAFCITNQNPPLAPGRYETGFQTRFYLSIQGEDIETDVHSFHIEFEIR